MKGSRRHKPWFNLKCKTARKKYHLTKRIHEKLQSQNTKSGYKFPDKHYKNTLDDSYKQRWVSPAVNQILKDQYIQKWHSEIDKSSKGLCYSYRIYKTIFSMSYLVNMNKKKNT
jgi:hypothetical protein